MNKAKSIQITPYTDQKCRMSERAGGGEQYMKMNPAQKLNQNFCKVKHMCKVIRVNTEVYSKQ